MEQAILKTKLFIPSQRARTIPRPYLIDKLDQGLDQRLTLVSAPAGFGKTTLITAWAHHVHANKNNIQFCWLSLNDSDNDSPRFLAYFVAAIQTAVSTFGQTFQASLLTSQAVASEIILTQLINESSHFTQKVVIVLDDYHLINLADIHNMMQFLINHAPHQLHFVLTTRTDPPLPLARYRARGQLSELSVRDLRFTAEETAAFLKKLIGTELTVEQLTELEQKTEGWPAGLQIFSYMMKQTQQPIDQVLPALIGSQGTVFDYLSDEIMKQLPDSQQEFLLQTSFLTQLSNELCQAVTSDDDKSIDSQYLLFETLIENNLFLSPIDAHGVWYRYHPLFAEFLQKRLQTSKPTLIPTLHKRASDWYRKRPFPELAIQHALKTQDEAFAIGVIAEQADILLRQGNSSILVQAVQSLKSNWIKKEPNLALRYSLALALQGKVEGAQKALSNIWPHLQTNQLGAAYVIQTEIARRQNKLTQMLKAAEQAHAHLNDSSTPLTQLLGVNLADLYAFRLGKTDAALQILNRIFRQLRESEQPYLFFHVTNLFAATHVLKGELQEAHEIYHHAIKLAKEWQATALLGAIYAGIGKICFEWNALDTAEKYLRAGIKACQQLKAMTPLISNAIALAKLLSVQGKHAQAKQLLKETRQAALENLNYLPRLNHWRDWRQADNGWISIAVTASQTIDPHLNKEIEYPTLFAHLKAIQTDINILPKNGRFPSHEAQIEKKLNSLYQLAEQAGQIDTCIDILLTRTIYSYRVGKMTVALNHLINALTLAKPYGYLRLFLDFNPLLPKLLKQCYQHDKITAELQSIIKRILNAQINKTEPITLFEMLTPRENDVLRLLGDGLTNQAIASDLHLSVGTVRWHARNIYSKLEVSNRTQAVARARALNLLS